MLRAPLIGVVGLVFWAAASACTPQTEPTASRPNVTPAANGGNGASASAGTGGAPPLSPATGGAGAGGKPGLVVTPVPTAGSPAA